MAGRAAQSLWNLLQPPERISLWRAAGGWTLVTAAVLLLLWLTGPVGSNMGDTINHVEAGNRIVLGQRLNVDFMASHWGPLYVWLVAVGIRLSGSVSPIAIHWVQAISVVVLGGFLFLVALPRLRLPLALFLLAAADLLLITASPLGHMVWRQFSYGMYYNAMCFVVLAALFVSILIPRRESSAAGRWCDVLLEGLALAMLFALKAWFVVGPLAAYVLIRCLWPRPGEKRFWGLLGLLFFALFAVPLANLGGGWRPYLHLLTGYVGGDSDVNPLLIPMRYIQFNYNWGLAVLAVLIALVFAHQAAVPLRRLIQLGLFYLAAMGAFLLGTSASCQDLEVIPFFGVIPLAAVIFAARNAQEKTADLNRLGLYSVLLLAALMLATDPKNSLVSRAFMVNSFPPPPAFVNQPVPTVDPADLAAVKYYDQGQQTVALTGIELLRAAHVPQKDVLWISGCVIAPLNHLVGNPPARGSFVYTLIWSIVPPERHPFLVPSFLEDTQWILRLKKDDYDWRIVMSHSDRKDYFENHFIQVGENQNWILYRRTSP